MRTVIKALLVALIVVIPATAIADVGDDHSHGDTGERLEEAGFTPEQVAIIEEHFDELDAMQDDYYGGHGHDDGEGFWAEVGELVSDPAHWMQEFLAEAAFLSFNLLIFDRLIHRHRQGKHTLEGDQ